MQLDRGSLCLSFFTWRTFHLSPTFVFLSDPPTPVPSHSLLLLLHVSSTLSRPPPSSIMHSLHLVLVHIWEHVTWLDPDLHFRSATWWLHLLLITGCGIPCVSRATCQAVCRLSPPSVSRLQWMTIEPLAYHLAVSMSSPQPDDHIWLEAATQRGQAENLIFCFFFPSLHPCTLWPNLLPVHMCCWSAVWRKKIILMHHHHQNVLFLWALLAVFLELLLNPRIVLFHFCWGNCTTSRHFWDFFLKRVSSQYF